MTEWNDRDKAVHYCPDFKKARSGKILTYETACGRYFLPQWITQEIDWVGCLDCLDAVHGKVKNET